MRSELRRDCLDYGMDLRLVSHVDMEAFDPIRNVCGRGHERAIDNCFRSTTLSVSNARTIPLGPVRGRRPSQLRIS
jgi:hypothetical protein